MEDMHRTHKEPAWGWIGALLDASKPAAPISAKSPARLATPAAVPARRVAC